MSTLSGVDWKDGREESSPGSPSARIRSHHCRKTFIQNKRAAAARSTWLTSTPLDGGTAAGCPERIPAQIRARSGRGALSAGPGRSDHTGRPNAGRASTNAQSQNTAIRNHRTETARSSVGALGRPVPGQPPERALFVWSSSSGRLTGRFDRQSPIANRPSIEHPKSEIPNAAAPGPFRVICPASPGLSAIPYPDPLKSAILPWVRVLLGAQSRSAFAAVLGHLRVRRVDS